jgi:enoyl-CoA hydratase/carnithine racemase
MTTEILRHDGDIVEIKLARPPVNALDPALCNAVRDAVMAASSDGARAIVLSGGQKVFSAGLDVPYLLSLGDDRAALKSAWEAFFGACSALARSAVPVVAAVDGHSPAGGCVFALCCDYRVMARSPDPAKAFRIGLNEVAVGLVAPEAVQYLMQRIVGFQRSERLLADGAMLTTDEAHAQGIVDEICEPGEAVLRALAWLQKPLKLPRMPLQHTREIARADLVAAITDPKRVNLDLFIDSWFMPDTQAGLRALVAKLGK